MAAPHPDQTQGTITTASLALEALERACHPTPAEIQTRMEALTREAIGKPENKRRALEELEQVAVARIEIQQLETVLTAASAAERALDQVRRGVVRDRAALSDIPDYRPEPERGQSETAHEIRVLRAELRYRETLEDWRDASIADLLEGYTSANDGHDWITVAAIDRIFERMLKGRGRALGESAEAVTMARDRIAAVREEGRRKRGAEIDPDIAELAAENTRRLEQLERRWSHYAMLLPELKKQRRYPLALAGIGR